MQCHLISTGGPEEAKCLLGDLVGPVVGQGAGGDWFKLGRVGLGWGESSTYFYMLRWMFTNDQLQNRNKNNHRVFCTIWKCSGNMIFLGSYECLDS